MLKKIVKFIRRACKTNKTFYVAKKISLILSYKLDRKIITLFEKYGYKLRNSFLVRFLLINS